VSFIEDNRFDTLNTMAIKDKNFGDDDDTFFLLFNKFYGGENVVILTFHVTFGVQRLSLEIM
jgi:hypothetical protein